MKTRKEIEGEIDGNTLRFLVSLSKRGLPLPSSIQRDEDGYDLEWSKMAIVRLDIEQNTYALWFEGAWVAGRKALGNGPMDFPDDLVSSLRTPVDRLKEIIQTDFYAAPMGGCTERLATAIRDQISHYCAPPPHTNTRKASYKHLKG